MHWDKKSITMVDQNTGRLLDPLPWPEGSYEIGSVCPSLRPYFSLSVRFVGVGSLVFPET